MASACRSAVLAGARSVTARSKTLISKTLAPKSVPSSPFSSPTIPISRSASRIVSALGSVESMLPLHSAIASARLRSSIAADSTCWSWLSQGLATPL
ncbi:protein NONRESPONDING TO OXYLIPINS 2, mitochondrial isoform X1 [Cornus florida]|uniref:protein NONRESPONDING TO OXYLIPINS 2, mitochondrial isoform X1 n=1 Tax=Cornus florida TaxID=4283 RepID=UPI0028996F21|nr:protein NONRESPONDING TO OXYLIPINS 2, mitochondrial isoform X1 [Cornus florida]